MPAWYTPSMEFAEIAHFRLAQQRLSRPDVPSAAEVVRWFGAVQAQEYAHSLYAIGLRMPAATEPVIERAIADKSIVRTWPMRGTIHYVPAEDTRWMLHLLARRTSRNAASIYRRAGLTSDIFTQAGAVLERTLAGGKQLTRKELYAALEAAGIATTGEQRGLHLLGYWAREGLICLGPRRGKQPTYTLLDEWIPNLRQLEGDEALATLATRYFTGHGPATAHDFAWWSGLTLAEARRGMANVEREFARETIDGQTYWFSPSLLDTPPVDHGAYLLPPYDEFTVAYRDRSALLDPALPASADPFTILGPILVVDGRMAGSWKRTLARDVVTLSITLFTPLDAERRAAVEQAAQRYGRFLGAPVTVEW